MRELTLIETGYLAAGLLLCLTLPLLMSLRGPKDPATRRRCLMIVWTGQLLLALTGVVILVSARWAPFGTSVAVICYAACVRALLRQFSASQLRAG